MQTQPNRHTNTTTNLSQLSKHQEHDMQNRPE